MYGESLVTSPATEPVTLSEALTHLGLPEGQNDYDRHVSTLIEAARRFVEERTNRQIVTATWDFAFDAFPLGRESLLIPRAPLQSITSITYVDSDGDSTVWSSSNYEVDANSEPGRVYPTFGGFWPSDYRFHENTLTVRAVCGYGDADDVPATVKTLILQLVDDWFNNRSGQGEAGAAADALLNILKLGDEWLSYGRDN